MKNFPQWIVTHKVLSGVFAIVIIAALAGGGYFGWQYYSAYANSEQAQFEKAQKERDAQIAEIANKISLPSNEEPIIATVSDKSVLPNEEFFKRSQNGDRILMYPKAKKVYLYRPAEKRVLAVAPLNYKTEDANKKGEVAATSSAQASPSGQVQPTTTILLR